MKVLYFNPKDGNLNMEKPSEFRETVKGLKPKRHVMEIKEYSERRSLGANAYYWKIVIQYFLTEMPLVDSKSNRDYMHYDVLGQELRMVEDKHRPGKMRMEQTHTMTGSEFWKYIKKCEYLFQEYYNGSFPPPKSLGYDETKK